jgi:molybdate transport system substrate-binding protein
MLRSRGAIAWLCVVLLGACVGPPPAPTPATVAGTPTPAPAATPTPLAAARSGPTSPPAAAAPTPPGRQSEDPTAVVVFADSALARPFAELASDFMLASHDATGVSYRFDSPATLGMLLQQGADADVFASAEPRQMDTLRQAGRIDGMNDVLTRDRLVVVVSAANPQGLHSLEDLARPGVRFVVPEPANPTTAAVLATFDKASADPAYGAEFRARAERNILARDGDARFVVGRIARGEVSAGVVYASDAAADDARASLQVIDIPDAVNTPLDYSIAVIKAGTNARGGHAFMTYALSARAQAIFTRWGFTRATGP